MIHLFYQYYHDIIVKYLTPTGYELCAINILRHFGGKVKYCIEIFSRISFSLVFQV